MSAKITYTVPWLRFLKVFKERTEEQNGTNGKSLAGSSPGRSVAEFPETGLKQVFPREGTRGDARKSLKNMVGRAGIEPAAR